MAWIDLDKVSFTYTGSKKAALYELTISLEQGKVYGLMGPNGSGKTTLANLLVGFIPNYYQGLLTGTISILDKNMAEATINDFVGKIGYVFQNPFNQISGIKDTVFDEVAYGLENLGTNPSDIVEIVETILREVGIDNLAQKSPYELSGGQQQKVAIASALALQPDILILDEPVSQLDPESGREIYQILKNLRTDSNTIIIIDHNFDKLAEFCDELILLRDGVVYLKGEPQELIEKPQLLESEIIISDKMHYQMNYEVN